MQKKKSRKGFLAGGLLLLMGILYSCTRQESAVLLTAAEVCAESAAEAAADSAAETTGAAESTAGSLWVHVCGAVKQEGVYELPAGSRYQQAVEAAGGFTEEADTGYLNLASAVVDGEQIRVPTREEAAGQLASEAEAADGLVNINTASQEELMTLPGIGEAKAEAILEYRETYGAFQSIEDIMLVPGIKEGAYSKLKARIKVGSANGEQGFSSG